MKVAKNLILSNFHTYVSLELSLKLDFQGCKMNECKIVYTPWENLKKTSDMVVGQVGYHNSKRVKYITVKKNSDIVKKIEKTRSPDKTPDLQAERQERDRRVIAEEKNKARLKAEEENKQKLVSLRDTFLMEHNYETCSEFNALQFMSICSIRICKKFRDISRNSENSNGTYRH